ncbi:transcriptional regulator GutM [Micropruina sonneratiae]|uniref:transcriptional regulator GutM n=1 Tax=Micropruina sonneratiae TaxID=2986940 RepID=UPI002226DF0B|nr:transcriptional regulator GutM [Micropruina sp. KQZ13P-5]MCW3158947.1 transcriptional regulator GutM [Micropruina sp. KQZ13P-5]
MGWEFAAILGGALVVSLMLGLWQQGRYARSVNAMVRTHHGQGRLLVTGRGLGKLKGTIVMLVIEDAADEVVAASKLRGSTIFATAKDAPELTGPVATLKQRAGDKQTGKAIDMALSQLKATRARVGEKRINAPRKVASGATRKVQA